MGNPFFFALVPSQPRSLRQHMLARMLGEPGGMPSTIQDYRLKLGKNITSAADKRISERTRKLSDR